MIKLQGVSKLIDEQKVREIVGQLKDPFLHKTLAETNGLTHVSINEEKQHVSVKVALAKVNTAEQLRFQIKFVDVLKEAGAATVGIRYEELSKEVLDKFRGTSSASEAQDFLSAS